MSAPLSALRGSQVRHPMKTVSRRHPAAAALLATLFAALLSACAAPGADDSNGPNPQSEAVASARLAAMVAASFQANGPVTLARLDQDETQKFCSDPRHASGAEFAAERARIEAVNRATIRWPTAPQPVAGSDAKLTPALTPTPIPAPSPASAYLGDWKQGEQIAQSGRGLTWTDPAGSANGGNCYNCHMIDKKEISFGTIGPSLWNYGKLRGVTDPASAAAEPVVKYTWAKLWNSKAFNACSNMPRVGHMGILTEAQLRDVMALLLDPKSPVNQ